MKFSKSYEPGEFEPDIYAAWEAAGVFNKKGLEPKINTFSIVMPPPNANGNLHIGHGLTIALEDSLTRYHRLLGDSTWYIPGADHAGFETWVVYEKQLEKQGHTRFEYSRDELYAKVWDYVAEQRGNMELQLRALGASCAWDDLTFTLDENVIARVYATFEKMWKDGMIYRGEKLVNYCPKHQTAFADIEVEHQEEEGALWDIKYEVVSDFSRPRSNPPVFTGDSHFESPAGDSGHGLEKTGNNFLVVSTTRPETLFGDVAVAVNPKDERYADLVGKMVKLPLTDRVIPIVADEHADPEYGTGCVKITPAHDFDDFEVGMRHNLPRIRVIDDAGRMVGCGDEYDGLSALECRQKVLEALKAQGLLVGEKKISHAVAHCYKCGTTIEPTLKEQWFIDVEKLAAGAIKHLENNEIKFHPANKKKVLIEYLKGLKDWNISRQIPWGIAIPMFRRYETDGSRPRSNSPAVAGSSRFEPVVTGSGHGLESSVSNLSKSPEWIFDSRTYLSEIEVGGVKYVRDEDTFDTWFSSSHWPIVCTDWMEGRENPYYPLNVMETGADILFAWVARMIMMGVYVTGSVPFQEVYLHGLVLDAHGKKMSKSKGNVINPMDLVTKYGSDAFRLGILRGRSAGMNQAFAENSVVAGRNLCNKLWNISRFIQDMAECGAESNDSRPRSNPPVFTGDSHFESPAGDSGHGLESFDLAPFTSNMGEDWICRELNECLKAVEDDMKNYRFAEAVEMLYVTIWDKYADWFIESQKIYRNVPLLKKTLEMILIMLHPFAPFVTEAIWQSLSWTDGFIINQKWPVALGFDEISAANFEQIQMIATEVRATLANMPKNVKVGEINLLYGADSLVEDNSLLIQRLTGLKEVKSCEGQPRGIRVALANREIYLDVSAEVVLQYKDALTEKILAVGRELNALNARLMNPNYVDRAPAELVKETRDGVAEKEKLIKSLQAELDVIQ